jgi:hypothetical protein
MSKSGTIRELSQWHAERLKAAFGNELTDAKTAACERTADLLALSEHFRTKLVDAESGDIEKLLRLEAIADAAVAALAIPAKPPATPEPLQVIFVDDFYMRLKSLLKETHPDHVTSALVEELSGRITELEGELKQAQLAAESAASELARARAEMVTLTEITKPEPRLSHGDVFLPRPTRVLQAPHAALVALNMPQSGLPPGIASGGEYMHGVDQTDQTGRRIP